MSSLKEWEKMCVQLGLFLFYVALWKLRFVPIPV